MSDSIELLSIGDASLDVFLAPTETETLCQVDTKECFICFSYGDKIPVNNLDFSVGGNAANNSVGTTRLGIRSAPVITLGTDEVAQQISAVFQKEGVDTQFVAKQEGKSNYSSVINYGGERTIFTYKAPKDYVFPDPLPVTPWIYLTSMGDSFQPYYDKVADHVRANPEIKLAVNPGSRQLRAGVDSFRSVLEVAYIVYINRKEAEMISGFGDSHGKERELLDAVSALGPRIPIITDGGGGSFVKDENGKYIKASVLPVDSYERTGAGDAFGSACIAALIKGKPFEEALLWGTVNSASVIGYNGSQRGLLHDSEMPVWLDRARSSGVLVEKF